MGFLDKVMDDWLGDPFGSYEAEAAAKGAAQTQAQMADAGIAEQRRQFDISNQLQRQMYEQGRQIMNPYVQAGYQAIGMPGVPYSPLATQPQQTASYREKPSFGGGGPFGLGAALDAVRSRDGAGRGVTPSQPSFGGGGGLMGSVFSRVKPSAVPSAGAMPAIGGPRTLGFYQEGATTGMPVISDVAGRTGGAYDVMGDFMTRGATAGERQAALAGLGTPEQYQAEVAKVEADPAFQEMLRQSEEGLLQTASATGGLRGGGTQKAIAQLRPALLSQFLSDRYSKLGGLAGTGLQTAGQVGGAGLGAGQYLTDIGRTTTGQLAQLGQASAAGQAAAGSNLAGSLGSLGQSMSSNIGNLLQQKGAALAGGQMASGSGAAGTLGPLLGAGATLYGGGAFKGLGKKIGGLFG